MREAVHRRVRCYARRLTHSPEDRLLHSESVHPIGYRVLLIGHLDAPTDHPSNSHVGDATNSSVQ